MGRQSGGAAEAADRKGLGLLGLQALQGRHALQGPHGLNALSGKESKHTRGNSSSSNSEATGLQRPRSPQGSEEPQSSSKSGAGAGSSRPMGGKGKGGGPLGHSLGEALACVRPPRMPFLSEDKTSSGTESHSSSRYGFKYRGLVTKSRAGGSVREPNMGRLRKTESYTASTRGAGKGDGVDDLGMVNCLSMEGTLEARSISDSCVISSSSRSRNRHGEGARVESPALSASMGDSASPTGSVLTPLDGDYTWDNSFASTVSSLDVLPASPKAKAPSGKKKAAKAAGLPLSSSLSALPAPAKAAEALAAAKTDAPAADEAAAAFVTPSVALDAVGMQCAAAAVAGDAVNLQCVAAAVTRDSVALQCAPKLRLTRVSDSDPEEDQDIVPMADEHPHPHPLLGPGRRSFRTLTSVSLFSHGPLIPSQEPASVVVRRGRPHFFRHYELGETLGAGAYGLVKACTDLNTGQHLACKVVRKDKFPLEADLLRARMEFQLQQRVSPHVHVVQVKQLYEDKARLYLVMERCSGGDLFEFLEAKAPLAEQEAAVLFAQIASAVRACHEKGVLHRDLKLENFLISEKDGQKRQSGRLAPGLGKLQLKLGDFGSAVLLPRGRTSSGWVGGSTMYQAPEVLSGKKYDLKADMWSLGIILHALLCGAFPFSAPTEAYITGMIKRGVLRLNTKEWNGLSSDARGLVLSMLCVDPAQRASIAAVSAHPWLLKHIANAKLKALEARSGLQRATSCA